MVNIKGIAIRGFRGLEATDLELEDGGAFITGMNGSGKSSVLEAIRFALLGYCQNTDRRGAGAKTLIAAGAEEASIDIELAGDRDPKSVRLRVVIPKAGAGRWNAEDYETGKPVAAKPEQLWPWIGVSEATLAAALVPAEHVTTQGFGNVLADLQAGTVAPETLLELCQKERLDAILEDYPATTGDDFPRQLRTLAGLRALGEEAYEWRRAAGRKVKDFAAKIPAEPPKPPTKRDGSPLGTEDAAAVQKAFVSLSRTRDALMQEIGEARQLAKVTPAGSIEELEKTIAGLEEANEKANAAGREAQKEHREAIDNVEAIKARLATLRHGIEATERRIEELSMEMEAYTVGKPCKTCGAKWTEARVKKATAKVRNTRMELVERLKNNEALEKNLGADLEKADAEVAKITQNAEKGTNAAVAAGSELAKARQELELAKRVAGVRSPEAVESDLVAVDEKLDRAKAAMGELAKMAEYEAQKAELEKWRARYDDLDWRVKAFRDGGVLNKLGADNLRAFEETVDAALEPFGYAFGLEVDGKVVIVKLARRGEELRLIERASSGERKLAEVAVALAFAEETGLALLDDLDHLDGLNRNKALAALKEAAGRRQVIAAGAWGKPAEPESLGTMAKALDPLRIIWVSAEVLKQAEAAA
jgi:chromosome segregation ATPase